MAADAARIIADNLARIRNAIDRLAPERSVRLVCVTKYASLEHVRLLLEAGAEELGENLLPAAAERFKTLRHEGYSFKRHLIGPQQSRKAADIPGSFDMFQALDRLKIARLLHQQISASGGEVLDVLLQVNISREDQKSGFLEEELAESVEQIRTECPTLRIRGLMAIPAGPEAFVTQSEFRRETARSFGQMRVLFDRICGSFPAAAEFDVLSQGMSQDYSQALAEGSNMVRIGSALFSGLEGK